MNQLFLDFHDQSPYEVLWCEGYVLISIEERTYILQLLYVRISRSISKLAPTLLGNLTSFWKIRGGDEGLFIQKFQQILRYLKIASTRLYL